MGQAFLSKTRAGTPGANELASVGGRAAGDAGVGGGGVELHSEVHLAASWSNRHASPDARRILRSGPRKGSKVARSCKYDTAGWSFTARMHGGSTRACGAWRLVARRKMWPAPLPHRTTCSSA